MRILGVDPGAQRTGVALIEVEDDSLPVLTAFWDIPGGPDGFTEWWRHKPTSDLLVVEDYIIRQGVHTDHAALKIVGFLRATEPNAIFQTPAGRKVGVSDAALKRLGTYLPGEHNRNAREAVRHVTWFLKRTNHLPTQRVGFPDV